MESIDRIKAAGLKLTPRRKGVYETMMELRHATIEAIIEHMRSKDDTITVSTIYRILDSFCKAKVLSLISHPDTGRCCYDITVDHHHHLFDGYEIVDYNDPELTELIRQHLLRNHMPVAEVNNIQVQITINKG
jgi:Fe2+ or Zn2+ uptake regulation protein